MIAPKIPIVYSVGGYELQMVVIPKVQKVHPSSTSPLPCWRRGDGGAAGGVVRPGGQQPSPPHQRGGCDGPGPVFLRGHGAVELLSKVLMLLHRMWMRGDFFPGGPRPNPSPTLSDKSKDYMTRDHISNPTTSLCLSDDQGVTECAQL